jgi:cAMP-specific phosphodiesterase 4
MSMDVATIFYIIELVFLGIFVIEIILYVFSFRILYLKDTWNVLDIIVIILSIAFVLLDLTLPIENAARGFLKIRGIFRLLRVFILVRKLNAVRIRRETRLKNTTSLGYDMRSPVEKVLEILNNIRD